jgi:hypothetical protein
LNGSRHPPGRAYRHAPSSNQVTTKGITTACFSNGKVVETWDSYDVFGMMQQVDAIPSQDKTEV